MISRIAFGLDISGYSTGRSQLFAAIASGNDCALVLLKDSPFSAIRAGIDRLDDTVEKEAACLRRCLRLGRVAVDVPIDLQNLGLHDAVTFAWQLTYRPIDKVLGGLAPLADRIGSPVARFRQILVRGQLFGELGRTLFETYPAASLKGLMCPHRGYKGNGSGSRSVRREIALRLGVKNWDWDDDKLDAAICALTAVLHPDSTTDGETLLEHCGGGLIRKLGTADVRAPKGFVLLNRLPEARMTLSACDCEKWLGDHELED